ncbi:MAG: WYL domain-containing protein [Bacteroidota bacterium]
MTPRELIIKVLLKILSNPNQVTKRDIANHINKSISAVEEYLEALENVGINLIIEKKKGKNYYAIEPNLEFDELKHLLPLSDADMANIGRALNYVGKEDAFYLKKKLATLYDFQKLGLNALRRPALEKLNALNFSKNNKKQVIFENYKSNSNIIKNRQVEVFDIDHELDMVQAYDIEETRPNRQNKHFKLSRITRVIKTDNPWQNEANHYVKPTDVFRIAMDNQVRVELGMDVFAYNSLIDNYPMARGRCDEGSKPNTFYFQAKVNPKFLGLTNFIMNNAGHVEIISPPELKEKVRERINILLQDLKR